MACLQLLALLWWLSQLQRAEPGVPWSQVAGASCQACRHQPVGSRLGRGTGGLEGQPASAHRLCTEAGGLRMPMPCHQPWRGSTPSRDKVPQVVLVTQKARGVAGHVPLAAAGPPTPVWEVVLGQLDQVQRPVAVRVAEGCWDSVPVEGDLRPQSCQGRAYSRACTCITRGTGSMFTGWSLQTACQAGHGAAFLFSPSCRTRLERPHEHEQCVMARHLTLAPYLVTPALHDVSCVKLVRPPLNKVLPLHGQPLPHKQGLHAQLCQEQAQTATQGAMLQWLCWTCSTRPAQNVASPRPSFVWLLPWAGPLQVSVKNKRGENVHLPLPFPLST